MTDTITDDDVDEITEIVELDVSKVSTVGSPANGTPWLLLKAVADDRAPNLIRVGDNEIGPGGRPNEVGPKAERIDRVIGEGADAIDTMLEGHTEIETMLDLRPDPEPSHAAIVPRIAGAQSATLKLEKELAAATDPIEKERLAEALTLARLRALHERKAVKTDLLGGEAMKSQDAQIQQFEKQLAEITDPGERAEFGAKLTHLRLLKSAYEDQIQRTNDAVRLAQDHATRPASLGQPSGAHQRGQVALEGESEDLGAVDPSGNGGWLLGHRGKIEPEPAAQAGAIEDELATKSLDPFTKEELGRRLTYLRLRMMHEPARSNPRAAQKALHDRVVKATKRAAVKALR
jgi:hypothetical protein